MHRPVSLDGKTGSPKLFHGRTHQGIGGGGRMARIYVQRGSAEGYRQNIRATLSAPLSSETLSRATSIIAREPNLAQSVGSIIRPGSSHVWGTKNRGRSEIARMRPGDLAIFVVEGTAVHYGVITQVLGD